MNMSKNQAVIGFSVAALVAGLALLSAPDSARASGAVCRLNWSNGPVADGNTSYFGVLVPAGTGIRTIGAGSNWSINVTGLQSNQEFRLANTNLTGGGTTFNDYLAADKNGSFSLYDNTVVLAEQYGPGVYKTELQDRSTAKLADCTPSFVISGPGMNATPTPTPIPAQLVCRLTWGAPVADGNQTFFNTRVAAGTGIRRIGGGSDWFINASGLRAGETFRLDNTNLITGQVTSNGTANNPFPLQADSNGNFSLYDNTTVDTDGRYAPGVFRTDLVGTAGTRVNCAPSFVIAAVTPPPPLPPSGSITANPNPCQIAVGADACTSFISWNTQKVSVARVYVGNPAGSDEKLFGEATSFSSDAAPWIKAGTLYVFRLFDYSSGGRGALLASVTVTGLPPATQPAPAVSLRVNGAHGPITINAGTAVTLTWTSTDATNCTASSNPGTSFSGARVINNTSGESTGALNQNTSFTLVCTGPGGSATDTVTVLVTVPPSQLTCSPASQTVNLNQTANLFASGGTGSFSWSAPDGSPSSGSGQSFATSYASSGTKTVTVASGNQSASCFVAVNQPVQAPTVDLKVNGSDGPITINAGTAVTLTWISANASACSASSSPSTGFTGSRATGNTSGESTGALNQVTVFNINCTGPGGSAADSVTVFVSQPQTQLTCSPNFQTANFNQTVNFNASGGTGSYFWSTSPSGSPSTGSGASFATVFGFTGGATATVTSGSQSASCSVNVVNNNQPGSFSLTKRVRNLSQNSGEFSAISANPNDTLEFVLYLNTFGNNTITNVQLADFLPSGLRFQSGSVTQDGAFVGDGLVNGNGLFLGNLNPGRSLVIRFRATVENSGFFSGGITTLTNRATANGNNVSSISDSASVNVSGINLVISNNQLSVQKFGRNITRGENAELSSITAYPNDTIEFVIRVRDGGNSTLYNVIARDALPGGLDYISGTTSVDNVIVSDGITGSGINLGTFSPNQEKIIKFSARVGGNDRFGLGTTSLSNTVTVSADNVSALSAQLPIAVFKGKVAIANVGKVPTGGETVIVALLISALLSYGVVLYGRTYFAQKRGVLGVIRKHAANPAKFNFV